MSLLNELAEMRRDAMRDGFKPRYFRFSPDIANQVETELSRNNQLLTFGPMQAGRDILFGMGVAVDPYMDSDIILCEQANA